MVKLHYFLRFFNLSLLFIFYANASVLSPISIDMNSTVNGVLNSDSETSPHSFNSSEYYSFSLTEEKRIVISVESDFYHKFYLLESNGSVIKEVSKYDYLNDKIVLTLTAGNYIVDLTSVFDDNYGTFTLTLQENIIHTTSIALESIVDGEWTRNSAVSEETSQYANYYTFILYMKTDIIIDLESNSPYVYLVDSNGSKIANASGNSIEHAKIVETLEAGEYRIEVTNTGSSFGLGIYTLRFKTNNILTTAIDLNSTVNGVWNISSGLSPRSKQYTNYYIFTLNEPKDIVIGMESDVSIERLYLLDSNKSIITESSGRRVILKHLTEGTYTIDTTSSSARTGNFNLFLKENIISNTLIDLNNSISNIWDETSGISQNSGSYSHYYTFTLDEQKNINISITGTNSYLYLLDENGNRNYSVLFKNGSIIEVLEAGTYTIEATQSIRKNESYQFEIYENKVKNEYVTLGDSISSRLTQNDGLSNETHNYAKEYTFTLLKKTNVVIDLNSSIDYRRVILKNDRGVLNYIFLRNVYSLEAGTYTLEMTYIGTDKNVTGDFTLALKENIIEQYPIIFNTLVHGSWRNESGVTFSGHYINQYTFSLAEPTSVTVQMKSEYSKSIRLNGHYEYRYNSEDIIFSKTLDAGTYVIDVVIDESSNIYQTGDYKILIEADVKIALPIKNLNTELITTYNSVIKWERGSSDTVGYKIYLNDKLVADVNASESSYTLNGLEPNSEYTYSVIAYNSAGESKAVGGSFKSKVDDYAWLIPIQHNILN